MIHSNIEESRKLQ